MFLSQNISIKRTVPGCSSPKQTYWNNPCRSLSSQQIDWIEQKLTCTASATCNSGILQGRLTLCQNQVIHHLITATFGWKKTETFNAKTNKSLKTKNTTIERCQNPQFDLHVPESFHTIGDGHPPVVRNPYNGYINPYLVGGFNPSEKYARKMGLSSPIFGVKKKSLSCHHPEMGFPTKNDLWNRGKPTI